MDSRRDTPKGVGCPIRTSADQRSLASPRGFSQRATSFIASWRQGIHRTPFSCSTHSSNTARAQDQTAQGDRSPPPAWTSARSAPALLMPQPTSHTFRTNHPTPSPHRWSHMGGQSIRQIRFTVSKNMPDTRPRRTQAGIPCERRQTPTQLGTRAPQWRLADSNR